MVLMVKIGFKSEQSYRNTFFYRTENAVSYGGRSLSSLLNDTDTDTDTNLVLEVFIWFRIILSRN